MMKIRGRISASIQDHLRMSNVHFQLHKIFCAKVGRAVVNIAAIIGVVVSVCILYNMSLDEAEAEVETVQPEPRFVSRKRLERDDQIEIMVDCIMDADETCDRAQKRDINAYWNRAGEDQMKAAVAAAFFAYRTGVSVKNLYVTTPQLND